jgi:dephospho-CoA kinase
MALLLLHRDATVTICHSRTVDLAAVCRTADVLVAAIGRPGFVTPEFVKPGATVIDVGINRVDEASVAAPAVHRGQRQAAAVRRQGHGAGGRCASGCRAGGRGLDAGARWRRAAHHRHGPAQHHHRSGAARRAAALMQPGRADGRHRHGKTYVAARLRRAGVPVIDADLLAREVVAPGTPGLAAVVARFGSEILTPEGALNRPALGAVVFADPAARHDLEAIVHPAVRQRIDAFLAAVPSTTPFAVADIPLLFETGRAAEFDVVVVAACTPEQQLTRGDGPRRRDACASRGAAGRAVADCRQGAACRPRHRYQHQLRGDRPRR